MLRIGMLGGTSWESTAEYYRLANEAVRDRLGGLHSAELVLVSVDFAPVERLMAAGRWEEVGDLLAAQATRVEAAGADLLLLCTNTLHKVSGAIEAAISIPFLSLVDVTAEAALRGGHRTVGLLGTRFTMEDDFYRDGLARHGVEAIVPDADDRAAVHRIIFEELVLGVVRPESRAAYRAVMARLVAAGAEAIVLGCTEIELLVDASDSAVPVLPTTRLHVEAALERALAAAPVGV